jgi:hypothetical protein
MTQRGRKSEASLEVAELAPIIGRPPPPADLTPEQAAVWSRVVECESPGFIKASQFGLLTNYCVLEARSRTEGLETKELVQISHEMTSIARSLRLTNQSRYVPDKASLRAPGGSRPWAFHQS